MGLRPFSKYRWVSSHQFVLLLRLYPIRIVGRLVVLLVRVVVQVFV